MPDISETTSPPNQQAHKLEHNSLMLIRSPTTIVTDSNIGPKRPNESASAELVQNIESSSTESANADVANDIESSSTESANADVVNDIESSLADETAKETPHPPRLAQANVVVNKAVPVLKPILKPLSTSGLEDLDYCRSTTCKILILCSGTDSVGEAIRLLYPTCEVVNVDINPKCPKLNYCVDLLTWDYKSVLRPGEFSIVWASPPCEGFSRIQTLNPPETQQRSFERSSKVAKKVLEIIDFLAPRDYFVENPKGLLRDTPFMQKWQKHRTTTSHCMFGTKYKKETDIWSNRPLTLPCCTADTPCAGRAAYGVHLQSATRGAIRGTPGSKLHQLHSIPAGMVRQIVEQADQSPLSCRKHHVTSSEPPITNLHILEEIRDKLSYLEAFEEEQQLPSLCKISLARMSTAEAQSLFLTNGTKRPRLMIFELGLSQPGMVAVKSRIMVDSGSTFTILSKDVALRRGYSLEPLNQGVSVALADGSVKQITHQAKLITHFLDEPRTLDFLILDIAGFDAIIGMDFLEKFDPDISWNRHSLRFRDSKITHWGIQKSPAQRKLNALMDTIAANEVPATQGMGAAHIVSLQEFTEQALLLQYPTIALRTPGYLAVLMPCAENETNANGQLLSTAEKKKRDPDKPATFEDFLDNMLPRDDAEVQMSARDVQEFKKMVKPLKSIFELPEAGLPSKQRGLINVEHSIKELPNTVPPGANAFRMSPAELKELKTQLDFLLDHEYIRPSSSPYGAPVLFAPKKDGKLRLCLDYRGLNNQTIKDKYPLPRDQDIFDQLQGAKYFTSLDALYGYWQVRMAEDSIEKTSIRTPLGAYEFLVMPFGLCNAPATFQRFMESVLREHLLKYCMVYIDDIIIYSKTAEEHLQHIEAVLHTLKEHSVCIKWQKCHFFNVKLHFLGHIVSRNGIAPDPDKITALKDWPTPTNVAESRGFVGLANYYGRHTPMLADIIAPLTSLKDDIPFNDQWDAACDDAFQKAKETLISAEVLALPDPTLPYIVRTDASLFAVGGSLHQIQNGVERVIAYESKKLSQRARDWPTHDRELFAYFHCFSKWRHYLHGAEVTAQGDHRPLLHIKTQKSISGKQARWLQFLEIFDIKLEYTPGKDLVGPDKLSRRPDLSTIAGIEALLLAQSLAVPPAQPHSAPPLDTEELNATESAERYNNTELLGDLSVSSALLQLLQEATKLDATYKLVRDRQLVPEKLEQYEIINGILYYKGNARNRASARIFVPEDIVLRYKIIYEFHDTPIQGHFGRLKTTERVSRYFYWPDLEATVDKYVKSCDKCQRFKTRTHKTPSSTASYPIPDYPWQYMTMDEKSGLPTSTRGNNAVWVFVDKLTKRAHFAPVRHKLSSEQIARLFMDVVFKHHGIPEVIISDRDSIFTASFWDSIWKLTGTNLNMSTSNNPQTDGLSERTIRTLVELVANYAEAHPSDWDEHLPALEFAYNDSAHAVTGFSPFELDMGRSPSTPIKLLARGLLAHRQHYTMDSKGLSPQEFLDRLSKDLAETKRKLQESQIKQKKRMEKGTVPVEYEPGERVYMEHPDLHTPLHKSMDPKYVGPFKVLRRVSDGVYELDLPFEYRFRHPVVNARKLKRAPDRRNVQFAEQSAERDVDPPAQRTPVNMPPSITATTTNTQPQLQGRGMHITDAQVRPKKPGEESVSDAMVRLSDETKGRRGWVSLNAAITQHKLWDAVHDYIQSHKTELKRADKIFDLVSETFNNKRYLGYITEFDASEDPTEGFPYSVTFSDGDRGDYKFEEIQRLVESVRGTLNATKVIQYDVNYTSWRFPIRLARIYAKLTRPYSLDAFDTSDGLYSKARSFCNTLNPFYNHDLTGQSIWAVPDLNLIGKFLKHFIRQYESQPHRTSTMLIIPYWPDKMWWKHLKSFRLMDFIPQGIQVLERSDFTQQSLLTPWHSLALYIGPEYYPDRVWKAVHHHTAKSSKTEKQRLQLVHRRNLLLSGNSQIDTLALDNIANNVLSLYGIKSSPVSSSRIGGGGM